MGRWCLALVFAAGCYRPAAEAPCSVTCDYAGAGACPGSLICLADGVCHAPGGGCGDEHPDGPPIDPDAADGRTGPPYCFGRRTGAGLLQYCAQTLSTDQIELPSFIHTGTCAITVDQASTEVPTVCVMYAKRFSVDSIGLRVEGPRPLVLVATDTITIDGVLDVASHVTSMPGPGSNPAGCGPTAAAKPSNGGGKGGGAGGTAQGAGGAGGAAGSDGVGAQPKAPEAPGVIRGGCSGDNGVSPNGCAVGRGGGAIYLIAGASITIGPNGKINASGSGAGLAQSSGCGGGAGGMIGFDAPVITNNGILIANGGGGSSGANGTPTPGNDPSAPATGGSGGGNVAGGSGGGGAGGGMLEGLPGGGGAATLNGGGGGGGAGWIVVYGGGSVPYLVSAVSPQPTSP